MTQEDTTALVQNSYAIIQLDKNSALREQAKYEICTYTNDANGNSYKDASYYIGEERITQKKYSSNGDSLTIDIISQYESLQNIYNIIQAKFPYKQASFRQQLP